MHRRTFLKQSLGLGAGVLGGSLWAQDDLLFKRDLVKLTILYTNDWHSRIEPWPESDPKNPGLGGAARRSTLIKNTRDVESNVLLLDAGDVFQGTPYYNFYGGELEYKLMSAMGYDATTVGNHDFDGGLEQWARVYPNATFDILCANYDFSDTPMAGKTKPYKVFEKQGIKVGVFGLGVELQGLVGKELYGNTQYLDPLEQAAKISYTLKHELKCDYIICLSHLGDSYPDKKVCDKDLAKESLNINLIIGGHTHRLYEQPMVIRNRDGQEVYVTQMGWAGINLGRMDVYFQRGGALSLMQTDANSYVVGPDNKG